MIDTTFLNVTATPTGADAIDLSSLGETGLGLQLSDLKEFSFGNTLFTQLQGLTDEEGMGLPKAILNEKSLSPDGKELPLLPQAELSDEMMQEASLDVEDNAELTLKDEKEKIITALPLTLQTMQERAPEIKSAKMVLPAHKDVQVSAPGLVNNVVEDLPVENLSLVKSDEVAIKADVFNNGVEMLKPKAQITEKTIDPNILVNTALNAKPAAAESPSAVTSNVRLSIDVPVQQGKWADNLAGRVVWMAMNSQQSAQISLNPAELGPIEVKVSLNNDQASVNFVAHNNTIKDAIEEAFPRLRDMMSESGLNLSQSSVSDQSLSQRQSQSDSAKQDQSAYSFTEDTDAVDSSNADVVNVKIGLVDQFV